MGLWLQLNSIKYSGELVLGDIPAGHKVTLQYYAVWGTDWENYPHLNVERESNADSGRRIWSVCIAFVEILKKSCTTSIL